MTTRSIGARIPRNEDPRLLLGLGCFVDDVNPPGVLHGASLRSRTATHGSWGSTRWPRAACRGCVSS